MGLHKIHFSWLESYGDQVARVDIHGNKLSNLPMNFFELLPCLDDLDVSCNMIEKLPEDGSQDLKFVSLFYEIYYSYLNQDYSNNLSDSNVPSGEENYVFCLKI